MPAAGADLANDFQWGLSIAPKQITATENGSGVDFRDCGPEVTVLEAIGTNPGDDTTITTKLQHSHDNSTFADMTSATLSAVSGDTANQVTAGTFFNRARRYVRAVSTVTGTSPVIQICVVVGARKTSY